MDPAGKNARSWCAEKMVNLTKDMRTYFCMAEVGTWHPFASKEACRLHDSLMASLGLMHEEEDDRKAFGLLLAYFRRLDAAGQHPAAAVGNDGAVIVGTAEANISYPLEGAVEFVTACVSGRMMEWCSSPSPYFAFLAELGEGVSETQDMEASEEEGVYVSDKANTTMAPSMVAKVRNMGLVPVLLWFGTYHETDYQVAGVIPSALAAFQREWKGGYKIC